VPRLLQTSWSYTSFPRCCRGRMQQSVSVRIESDRSGILYDDRSICISGVKIVHLLVRRVAPHQQRLLPDSPNVTMSHVFKHISHSFLIMDDFVPTVWMSRCEDPHLRSLGPPSYDVADGNKLKTSDSIG
jgi:hypothetical protein